VRRDLFTLDPALARHEGEVAPAAFKGYSRRACSPSCGTSPRATRPLSKPLHDEWRRRRGHVGGDGGDVGNEGAVDDELRAGAGDEVARHQLQGVRNLSEEDPLLQAPSSMTSLLPPPPPPELVVFGITGAGDEEEDDVTEADETVGSRNDARYNVMRLV
jgi:hypothetical protein